MNLPNTWYVIVAIFWVGFFILDGFDFGVGMLHSFVGRSDGERRIAINTIGPVWDGNEVWLVVAGAAIFAAFPAWYATMFSTFYLALIVVLVALIARGMSFEFSRKIEDPRWRSAWRWSLTVGSALIPFLLGTALGDLLHGLPINSDQNYTGSFWGLLVPFGLFTGLTLTVLCLLLGSAYLALKTDAEVRDRAARLSGRLGWLAALITLGWVIWSHVGRSVSFAANAVDVLALVAVTAAAWLAKSRSEGWVFTAAVVAIGGVVSAIFVDLFPDVMVSSTNAAYTLTVAGAASPSYTLKVMTVVAVIFFPVVLAYQGWSLWTFRQRLTSPPTPASDSGAPAVISSSANEPLTPAIATVTQRREHEMSAVEVNARKPQVLFVYYTHTNQAQRVSESMAEVLRERGCEVSTAGIEFTDKHYAKNFSTFPFKHAVFSILPLLWPQLRRKTGQIRIPDTAKRSDFDLVVVGSPTWFFRTAMPVRSYLKSEGTHAVLAGKPFAAYVVCRRYWSVNLKEVRNLGTSQGGEYLDGIRFTYEGGQIRSLLSLLSYFGKGEMVPRVLGIKIPPTNLKPDFGDPAHAFANHLADRLRPPQQSGEVGPQLVVEQPSRTITLPEPTADVAAHRADDV